MHDPSINSVVVSRSTLKYALIALSALGLLASCIYLLVVGLLSCPEPAESSLCLYLIVMGCAGCVRLLTFFSCPFDYSKSILSKMYEYLVWRLVVNRFKAAYHGSVARLKTSMWEQGDSASLSRRVYFRLACLGGFFFNFLCCAFQCCSCCFKDHDDDDDNENNDHRNNHRDNIECAPDRQEVNQLLRRNSNC